MLTGDSAAAAAPIAAERESPKLKPGSIRPASWPAFAPCNNPACAWPWWATASTTLPRWPRPMPASPWAPARTWPRRPATCCCCAPSLPPFPRPRPGPTDTAHHAPEPRLGRGLQPARHSTGRGAALSGIPHSAYALAGRGRHGPQLSLRAGQQFEAAQVVDGESLEFAASCPCAKSAQGWGTRRREGCSVSQVSKARPGAPGTRLPGSQKRDLRHPAGAW